MHREVHLRDLVAVLARHWRIVALLAFIVPGGAYFAGRSAVPRYQSKLTVQVSSAKQVYSQWEDIRIDEMALKTDPVLSEALVLTTQRLALRVVDALRLHLLPADPSIPRGEFFADIQIDSLAQLGEYELTTRGPIGFELRDRSGKLVSRGPYTERASGSGFSFRVPPGDGVARNVKFYLESPQQAAAWVSGGTSYSIREGTNAFDIFFTGTDGSLVPLILNQIALQLRVDGTERMKDLAGRKRDYIAEQLAQASQSSQDKLREGVDLNVCEELATGNRRISGKQV